MIHAHDEDENELATGKSKATDGADEAVKPLDLSMLLRDAFLAGRGLKDGDKLSDEDQAAWMAYDPERMMAYGRITAALDADRIRSSLATLPPPTGEPECATEGCGKPSAVHFIRGDVGSYYCADCYKRIHAGETERLASLAAPPQVELAEGEAPTDEEMTEAGKCLECGALDSEPCQAPCWREFHGGTREPRQEPLTDVQKSIRDGTFGVRSSS